jgi:hypothetical protein
MREWPLLQRERSGVGQIVRQAVGLKHVVGGTRCTGLSPEPTSRSSAHRYVLGREAELPLGVARSGVLS